MDIPILQNICAGQGTFGSPGLCEFRIGDKYLYPLSHLDCPRLYFHYLHYLDINKRKVSTGHPFHKTLKKEKPEAGEMVRVFRGSCAVLAKDKDSIIRTHTAVQSSITPISSSSVLKYQHRHSVAETYMQAKIYTHTEKLDFKVSSFPLL